MRIVVENPPSDGGTFPIPNARESANLVDLLEADGCTCEEVHIRTWWENGHPSMVIGHDQGCPCCPPQGRTRNVGPALL